MNSRRILRQRSRKHHAPEFYELTIEEGTAFGKRPPAGLPDGDRAADMGQLVHETLTGAGFSHYEISGYARPGRRCRHNLTYWTFGDYLGIGAGAHGKVTREGAVIRTVRESNPLLYIQSVLEGRSEKSAVRRHEKTCLSNLC